MPVEDELFALSVRKVDQHAYLAKAQQQEEAAEQANMRKVQVVSMLKAADSLSELNQAEKAMAKATAALDLSEEVRFDLGRGAALAALARIVAKHGGGEEDSEFAYDSVQDARRLFRKLDHKKGEALTLWSAAQVESAFGSPQQVVSFAEDAAALFREVGDAAGEATSSMTLADGLVEVGDARRAAAAVKRSMALEASLNLKKKEANCLKKLATIYYTDGEVEKGDDAVKAAREVFKGLEDFTGEAEVLGAQRDFYLESGRFAQALEKAKELVSLHHSASDQSSEGRALLRLSEMLLGNNDLQRAQRVAEVALGVLNEAQDGDGLKQGIEMLGAIKNASVKMEMQQVIELNRDFMHVPKSMVIDPGLNKRIQAAYSEATRQGLF